MSYYESSRGVGEYLLLHYGTAAQISPRIPPPLGSIDFPARCVQALLDPARLPAGASALEAGCAVGRAAFELAAHVSHVRAFDYSRAFIDTARRLAAGGTIDAAVAEEGDRSVVHAFTVPPHLPRERVHFETGDAQSFDPGGETFDVVLAANLLCRLPDPSAFLARVPGWIRPGGQLLLTTPCTWLDEYTPRAAWIGGTAASSTRDALLARLSEHFTFDLEVDLPFLIREHARKFQWSIAWGSRWIRRA